MEMNLSNPNKLKSAQSSALSNGALTRLSIAKAQIDRRIARILPFDLNEINLIFR
jgi:hypothetical protein